MAPFNWALIDQPFCTNSHWRVFRKACEEWMGCGCFQHLGFSGLKIPNRAFKYFRILGNMLFAKAIPPNRAIIQKARYLNHHLIQEMRRPPSSLPVRGRCQITSRLVHLSTSTASTIRDAGTQHWAGKARSISNGKWPKRVLGAARNRDRSKEDLTIVNLTLPLNGKVTICIPLCHER